MRLSPRDPRLSQWHTFMADAELGLGHLDAAIEQSSKAIDAGYRVWTSYLNLAAAHAQKGDIDEAKRALTEARRVPGQCLEVCPEGRVRHHKDSQGRRLAGANQVLIFASE